MERTSHRPRARAAYPQSSLGDGRNSVKRTGEQSQVANENATIVSRLTDIFELQDEITKKVVAAIEPKLLEAEAMRSQPRSSEDLDAWDLVMQANSLLWRLTKADIDDAVTMLRSSTTRYPDYSPAHSILAVALLFRAIPVGVSHSQDVKEAVPLASRAAELDDSDPWAH